MSRYDENAAQTKADYLAKERAAHHAERGMLGPAPTADAACRMNCRAMILDLAERRSKEAAALYALSRMIPEGIDDTAAGGALFDLLCRAR